MCKQETHWNAPQKEIEARNRPAPENPPFDAAALELALGKIICMEYLCPGIYFVTAINKTTPFKLGVDYYVVTKDSPAISDAGKAYGKVVPDCPELLSYRLEDEHSGRFVVEYEAYRFMINNHMPLPEGKTLYETAMHGTESNPEYFGMYPVPAMTPWGRTLRHQAFCNGIYWLEPEECGWVLSVQDLLASDFPEEIQRLGKRIDQTREGDADQIGCLFFDWEGGFLVLRELASFQQCSGKAAKKHPPKRID